MSWLRRTEAKAVSVPLVKCNKCDRIPTWANERGGIYCGEHQLDDCTPLLGVEFVRVRKLMPHKAEDDLERAQWIVRAMQASEDVLLQFQIVDDENMVLGRIYKIERIGIGCVRFHAQNVLYLRNSQHRELRLVDDMNRLVGISYDCSVVLCQKDQLNLHYDLRFSL